MAFKRKYQTKAEIPPESLRHYFERDGAWFLDADTSEERAQSDEYRDRNHALEPEIERMNVRFNGVDPDGVRKLIVEKRKLDETQLSKAGEVGKVVESRIKGLKASRRGKGQVGIHHLKGGGNTFLRIPPLGGAHRGHVSSVAETRRVFRNMAYYQRVTGGQQKRRQELLEARTAKTAEARVLS